MDVENMDCSVKIEIFGIVTPEYYENVCEGFGIKKDKNRIHWFDYYAEYEILQDFIFYLMQRKIDFFVEFDGRDIYDYGKKEMNNNTES